MFNNKCFVQRLGKFPLSIPSFLFNREGVKTAENRINSSGNFDTSVVATLVSYSASNVYQQSDPFTSGTKCFERPQQKSSPPNGKQNTEPSCFSGIKKLHEDKVISKEASEIMLRARRVSTSKTFSAPWNKWVLWDAQRRLDPIDSLLNFEFNFLTNYSIKV